MDVARAHVRSWQAGYRGLLQVLPDAYLDGLRPEERPARGFSRYHKPTEISCFPTWHYARLPVSK
jgi:hypothetical protein